MGLRVTGGCGRHMGSRATWGCGRRAATNPRDRVPASPRPVPISPPRPYLPTDPGPAHGIPPTGPVEAAAGVRDEAHAGRRSLVAADSASAAPRGSCPPHLPVRPASQAAHGIRARINRACPVVGACTTKRSPYASSEISGTSSPVSAPTIAGTVLLCPTTSTTPPGFSATTRRATYRACTSTPPWTGVSRISSPSRRASGAAVSRVRR